MQVFKQDALEATNKKTNYAATNDAVYARYVLEKIHNARHAIKHNKIITSDELQRDIESW